MADLPPPIPCVISRHGFWVREDNLEQDLAVVRDVYIEDSYKTKLYSPDRGPEIVVDIGAHIGCFARLWHEKNPHARIVCIEACPENIPILQANVGSFATVIHAACTYEDGELWLLNAVRANCESTGGSVVVAGKEEMRQPGYQYWNDKRPLPKITLEEIMTVMGSDHIDLLKLDCEGSEISILGKSPSLFRIRFIFGEWHEPNAWNALRASRLTGWDYGVMSTDAHGRGILLCIPTLWSHF